MQVTGAAELTTTEAIRRTAVPAPPLASLHVSGFSGSARNLSVEAAETKIARSASLSSCADIECDVDGVSGEEKSRSPSLGIRRSTSFQSHTKQTNLTKQTTTVMINWNSGPNNGTTFGFFRALVTGIAMDRHDRSVIAVSRSSWKATLLS